MTDLVIGGRRAGAARPWRAGVIAIAMVGVAVVVAWFIYRRAVAYAHGRGVAAGICWYRFNFVWSDRDGHTNHRDL